MTFSLPVQHVILHNWCYSTVRISDLILATKENFVFKMRQSKVHNRFHSANLYCAVVFVFSYFTYKQTNGTMASIGQNLLRFLETARLPLPCYKSSEWSCVSPSLLFKKNRLLFPQGRKCPNLKLTIRNHLSPRIIITGATPPLTHRATCLWCSDYPALFMTCPHKFVAQYWLHTR